MLLRKASIHSTVSISTLWALSLLISLLWFTLSNALAKSRMNDDVYLVTYVHISKKSMREFYKLCFAGETFAEAMLVGVKDMVCF